MLEKIKIYTSLSGEEIREISRYKIVRFIQKLFRGDKLTDKQFLGLLFFIYRSRLMRWRSPHSFNEKMQWLKLFDRRKSTSAIVDKVEFKNYVAKRIGEEYVIPTLRVWNSPEEIDLAGLPPKYVIKCNLASGGTYIHTGEEVPDLERIKKIVAEKFHEDTYHENGEWPYKNVSKKILAEAYIEDKSPLGIPDYKFYCFDGVPMYIQINSYRDHYFFDKEKSVVDYQVFYDMDWKRQQVIQGYPYRNDIEVPKPMDFDKMKELAAKLSVGFPYVRVDMYNLNGRIYAGEMTFFPYCGLYPFKPKEWDRKLGELIRLGIGEA